jgi:hypothetical protein
MSVQYEIWLFDPTGVPLALFTDGLEFKLAWAANGVGALTLMLPDSRPLAYYAIDSRIEVWRLVDGGSRQLVGETCWLVRKAEQKMQGGATEHVITALHANDLLRRRIVAYKAASAQASKTAVAADNLLKAIMRENYGASATDAARDLSAWLSVAADLTLAPTVSKAFAWRKVYDVLLDVCQASWLNASPTPLYFDVVVPTAGTLEFRTYVNQRGNDHSSTSASPVVFSPERGNLVNPSVATDNQNEANYVYVGGGGQEASRVVREVSDAARIGTSPLNRCEAFRDSRMDTDNTTLDNEGRAELRDRRPKTTFAGSILDTPAARFGIEWSWGDRVVAEYGDISYDCVINALGIGVAEGRETITAKLENIA